LRDKHLGVIEKLPLGLLGRGDFSIMAV